MADEKKRVIDQTTDSSLSAGDYVIVDSESEGTRKFDLGTELTDIKEDFAQFKYGGGGVTDEARLALLQFLSKVALTDTHGQEYYDALFNALFPVATLTSITAVYAQSGTVYTHDSLDSLKDDLVVTAHYDDASEQTVTMYRLSGELTAGTNTITVLYGGKTTTFSVTVVEGVPSTYQIYDYVRALAKNNTNSTQWLILKEYDNLNVLSTECEVKSTDQLVNGQCIFGRRTEAGSAKSYAFYIGTESIGYHLHGVDSNPSVPHTPGERTVIKYTNTASSPSTIQTNDNQAASIVWENNVVIKAAPTLFTNVVVGTTSSMNLHASAEIHYIKFFDLSGNLISHYFPCVRKADNVIGMYDIVDQVFYTTSNANYSTVGNSSCYYQVGEWS